MQKRNLKLMNDIKIKVVLIGDKEVGKSAFLQRFDKNYQNFKFRV